MARFAALLFMLTILVVAPCSASDESELESMLREFLARADEKGAHETFWADDLVYTSSNGTRFDKATIMAGFEESDAPEADDPAPAIEYSADDVEIRVYGDTAVVAFKLVGTPADESGVLHYFNTGTFIKRDDKWQVVAWQATKIPD